MDLGSGERRLRFMFVSSNGTLWGGSEELWSAAAAVLAEQGHQVSVLKPNIDETQPRVRRLRELSCRISDLARIAFLPRAFYAIACRLSSVLIAAYRVAAVGGAVAFSKPDLIVVSQGGNFDGMLLANICRRMKKPYVLIAQKAADLYWPTDDRLARTRSVYTEALAAYFVSDRNRTLTQEQLGIDLPNSRVVRNPFLVPWKRRSDWPSQQSGLRLACVGRLFPAEKGQDLLVRVLAREKWRTRAVSVTVFGSGQHRTALEGMVRYHGLRSVTFGGFVDDVASIWDDHHGLVLPSRCEGLPLVVVEAMLSGRVPIVTDVAGNREIVDDGVTGFVAVSASEDAIDEALERAWQRRDEWQAIGAAAAERIRTLVPPDPAHTFAGMLLAVAEGNAATVDPLLDATVRSRRSLTAARPPHRTRRSRDDAGGGRGYVGRAGGI